MVAQVADNSNNFRFKHCTRTYMQAAVLPDGSELAVAGKKKDARAEAKAARVWLS